MVSKDIEFAIARPGIKDKRKQQETCPRRSMDDDLNGNLFHKAQNYTGNPVPFEILDEWGYCAGERPAVEDGGPGSRFEAIKN